MQCIALLFQHAQEQTCSWGCKKFGCMDMHINIFKFEPFFLPTLSHTRSHDDIYIVFQPHKPFLIVVLSFHAVKETCTYRMLLCVPGRLARSCGAACTLGRLQSRLSCCGLLGRLVAFFGAMV